MSRCASFVTALSAFVLALVFQHSNAYAGAWVQKKHDYFFKLSGTYLYTTEEYDSDGNIQDIRAQDTLITNTSYRELTATGYLEYGVTDRFTLVANLPFKVVTSKRTELPEPDRPQRNVEAVTGGLSDLTLSGRFLLTSSSLPVSLQAGVKIPLGYDPSPPDQGTPLGSGKVDVEANLLLGASFYPVPAYVTGGIGYRLRGGAGISNEYLYQIELGFTPGKWLVKGTLDGIYSTTKPHVQSSSTTTITNPDILKIIPTVGYAFTERFALGAEMFHTLEGKNTVTGTTYVLAVVFTR